MPKELSQVELQFMYYHLYPAMLVYGAPVIPNDRMFEYASPKKWTKILLDFNEYYMRILGGHLKSMGSDFNADVLKAIMPASETFKFLLNKTTADEMPGLIRKTFGKTVRMRGGGDDHSNPFRDYMMQSGGARMSLGDLDAYVRPSGFEAVVVETNTYPKNIQFRNIRTGAIRKALPSSPLYSALLSDTEEVYFYHIQTQATSWEIPSEGPAAVAAPPAAAPAAGVGLQMVPFQPPAAAAAAAAPPAAQGQDLARVPDDAVLAAAAGGRANALIAAIVNRQHRDLVRLQESRFGTNIATRMEQGRNLHSRTIKEELDELAQSVEDDLGRIKREAREKYARLNYNLRTLPSNTDLSRQSQKFIQTIIEALNTFDIATMLKGVRKARSEIQQKRKTTVRSIAAAATVTVGGLILYKWMTSEEAAAPVAPSTGLRYVGELLGSAGSGVVGGILNFLGGVSSGSGVSAAATSVKSSVFSVVTNATALVTTGATVVSAYTAYEVWSAVGVAEKDIDDIEKELKDFVVETRVQLINKLCDDYILSLNTVINVYKAGIATQPFALAAIYSTKGTDAIRRDLDQEFYLAHELQERSFPLLVTQLGQRKAQEVHDMYVALIAKSKDDINVVLTEMKHAFKIPEERAKWGLNRAQTTATAVVNGIGSAITSLAQGVAMAGAFGGGRRVTRSHTRKVRKGSKKSQSRRRR